MIKIDKALKEVWDWKDEIYQLNKGKSIEELVKFIKREASSVRRQTGLVTGKKKAAHFINHIDDIRIIPINGG